MASVLKNNNKPRVIFRVEKSSLTKTQLVLTRSSVVSALKTIGGLKRSFCLNEKFDN